MFAYAVKKEIVLATPCYGFEKGEELPNTPSREHTLSAEEIKTLWLGLDKAAISEDIQRILKLVLLTGQRSGEVASMHHTEINGRWWEFTPKETKITKEIPRKQRTYLTNTALELIGEGEGYVFKSLAKIVPNADGTMPEPRHITERAISHAVRRNILNYKPKKIATSKQTNTTSNKKRYVVAEGKKIAIRQFVPHDLRRTCATFISELGYNDATVDAVLAHLKKGEIRTYNKNKYDKEKQLALSAWETKLTSIITGTTGKTLQ
jgi:integrase